MQLALGEAGRMSQQSDHGVAATIRVFQSFTEHHVAAAFAMNSAGLGKTHKPRAEVAGVREGARVQLRIAAGQPAASAAFWWCLVVERREGDNLGPLPPPTLKDVWIDEGEGSIRRERDPLPRWSQGRRCARRGPGDVCGGCGHLAEIDVTLGNDG